LYKERNQQPNVKVNKIRPGYIKDVKYAGHKILENYISTEAGTALCNRLAGSQLPGQANHTFLQCYASRFDSLGSGFGSSSNKMDENLLEFTLFLISSFLKMEFSPDILYLFFIICLLV
jgi:hypothetical protein